METKKEGAESAEQAPRDVYDITIIGAGPTGLFACFYAGMRGMKTRVTEALIQPGGQVAVLYPEKFIYDAPGYPKIIGKDLVKQLVDQGFQFKPTLSFGERIEDLQVENGIIRLASNFNLHYSRTVLISSGLGAFTPKRLGNPEVEKFEGRGVYYNVTDKWEFKDKSVMIVGGGDSAVDWALNLKDVSKKVMLVHRRGTFRAHESSVVELFHSNVEVLIPYEVKTVSGNSRLESVTIFDNKTREEKQISVDAIIIQVGHLIDLRTFKKWGLEMEGDAIVVNGKMETNLPGVYAAGDVATQKGSVKLNLIATGYAQAALAVNCAKNYIDPKSSVFPGHSSEMRF